MLAGADAYLVKPNVSEIVPTVGACSKSPVPPTLSTHYRIFVQHPGKALRPCLLRQRPTLWSSLLLCGQIGLWGQSHWLPPLARLVVTFRPASVYPYRAHSCPRLRVAVNLWAPCPSLFNAEDVGGGL